MRTWVILGMAGVLGVACQKAGDERTAEEGRTAEARAGTATGEQQFVEIGTVSEARHDAVTLKRPTGDELKLSLDAGTRILRDGAALGSGALAEGSEVRASYVVRGDEHVAEQIEFMSPGAPEGQGPGGRGGDMYPEDDRRGLSHGADSHEAE